MVRTISIDDALAKVREELGKKPDYNKVSDDVLRNYLTDTARTDADNYVYPDLSVWDREKNICLSNYKNDQDNYSTMCRGYNPVTLERSSTIAGAQFCDYEKARVEEHYNECKKDVDDYIEKAKAGALERVGGSKDDKSMSLYDINRFSRNYVYSGDISRVQEALIIATLVKLLSE